MGAFLDPTSPPSHLSNVSVIHARAIAIISQRTSTFAVCSNNLPLIAALGDGASLGIPDSSTSKLPALRSLLTSVAHRDETILPRASLELLQRHIV